MKFAREVDEPGQHHGAVFPGGIAGASLKCTGTDCPIQLDLSFSPAESPGPH